MKTLFLLICLAVIPAVPMTAAAELFAEMPFDINAGVNPDGKLAVSFSVPVSLVDKVARDACVSGGMKVLDPSAPVVSASGDDIIISNIGGNLGRLVIVLTPFSSGRNAIGFAVKKIEVDGSGLWTMAQLLGLTQEKVFNIVMSELEKSFSEGMERSLASETATPQQLIGFSHDAASKTVYMSLANAFVLPAMPKMEFDSVKLEDGVITLSMSSSENTEEMSSKDYVLALDARSFSTLIAKVMNQSDSFGKVLQSVHYASPGKPGEDQILINGFISDVPFISGLVQVDYDVTYNAEVYVYMPEPNFICLEIRKVDVTWVGKNNSESYISGIASSLASLRVAQSYVIEKAVDKIASSQTMGEMAEVSKLNASTVGIRLKKGAVLPALSKYVDMTGVRMKNGRAYLEYRINFSD